MNTAAIVDDSFTLPDSAATFCFNMNYGGYDDWYLPSKSELAFLYCHSTAYTPSPGLPQSHPNCTAFGGKKSLITGFENEGAYWSSTEYNAQNANVIATGEGGFMLSIDKN